MAKIPNYYTKNKINNKSEDLQETKLIVGDLLKDLSRNTIQDLVKQVSSLVNSLNLYNKDFLVHSAKKEMGESYYALQFEALNFTSMSYTGTTVYIGLGIDLEMQRKVLGFWLKQETENSYDFWLRVCQELRGLGIRSVEIKYCSEFYWLSEAMDKVFD